MKVAWKLVFTCMAKFQVMNSQTGLRPAKADPTARPQNPDSVMGVSITRLGPNLSKRPLDTYTRFVALSEEFRGLDHVASTSERFGPCGVEFGPFTVMGEQGAVSSVFEPCRPMPVALTKVHHAYVSMESFDLPFGCHGSISMSVPISPAVDMTQYLNGSWVSSKVCTL